MKRFTLALFHIFQYSVQMVVVAYVIGFLYFIIITYQVVNFDEAEKDNNMFVSNGLFAYDENTHELDMKVYED